MLDINKEAKEYDAKTEYSKYGIEDAFIAGFNSKSKQIEIIQKQIDLLNSLDSKLQSKIESLIYMASEKYSDLEYFTIKISGIRLAKEEIRRNLKYLELELKEYE
jgi:hypothetical protein